MTAPTTVVELAQQISTADAKSGILTAAAALLVVGLAVYGARKVLGFIR